MARGRWHTGGRQKGEAWTRERGLGEQMGHRGQMNQQG